MNRKENIIVKDYLLDYCKKEEVQKKDQKTVASETQTQITACVSFNGSEWLLELAGCHLFHSVVKHQKHTCHCFSQKPIQVANLSANACQPLLWKPLCFCFIYFFAVW